MLRAELAAAAAVAAPLPLLPLVPPPELLPPPFELFVPVPLPLVSARVSTSRQSEYWSMSAGMWLRASRSSLGV